MLDAVPIREEIGLEEKWNIEAFYVTEAAWEEEFSTQKASWEPISGLRGRLGEGPDVCLKALTAYFDLQRSIYRLAVYAHMRQDEDLSNDLHKGMYQRGEALYHDFATRMSWIEPELLALPDETLQQYIASDELSPYRFYLETQLRMKKHTLSPKEEKLVALAGKALGTSSSAYRQFTDADFDFGTILDSEGKEHTLTQSSYGLYLRSPDRTLRENAFRKLHENYLAFENGICELYNGQLQADIFYARSHNFDSSLDASLYPRNIDPAVYHNLVSTVRRHLPSLHRYMALRKKVMGVPQLHLWDVYTPLVASVDRNVPYNEAVQLVIDCVTPLGEEYRGKFAKGLIEERWVDRYENQNKRSGAYSMPCYDALPYILMNYKGQLRDVFTLAHEGGHSMHHLSFKENQPFHYASSTIFVAEVASIFNEDLLFRHLVQNASSNEERAYLVGQKVEDMRGTLFRQTMFAEFELMVHEMAERGEPITPTVLKEKYRQLNADYFGPDVVIDEEIAIEWARIPHFYSAFYVYQYATGICAALALSERVNNGGLAEREAYLNFMRDGSSKYSLDLLRDAGVDMASPEPVEAALQKFDEYVTELDGLLAVPAK